MERKVKLICENIQDTETEVLSDYQGTLCLVRFIHFPKELAFFPLRFHYFHLLCLFVLSSYFLLCTLLFFFYFLRLGTSFIFGLSFVSRYFLISCLISSVVSWLFSDVLFSLHVFVFFTVFFPVIHF